MPERTSLRVQEPEVADLTERPGALARRLFERVDVGTTVFIS